MRYSVNLLLGFFILAAGCAGPQINWSDSNQIIASITTTRDDFKKRTEYVGPHYDGAKKVESDGMFLFAKVFLRAYNYDKTPGLTYQIYTYETYYNDWRFYNQAYDSDGKKLDFVPVTQKVGSCGTARCSKDEHVAINVTKDYLIAHQDTGLSFKIFGKADEREWSLPGSYIKAFLSVAK